MQNLCWILGECIIDYVIVSIATWGDMYSDRSVWGILVLRRPFRDETFWSKMRLHQNNIGTVADFSKLTNN